MGRVRFPLRDFLKKDSIQRSYQFLVDFNMSSVDGTDVLDVGRNSLLYIFGSTGNSLPIKEYHIQNVVLPQYNFKKETQKFGIFNRSMPIYDNEGVELKIDLKEDEDHTISKFITYLQKRIINEDGTYNPPIKSLINSIEVTVLDNAGNKSAIYRFKECFFTNATEPNYAYENNAYINYVVTFTANYYTVEYLK